MRASWWKEKSKRINGLGRYTQKRETAREQLHLKIKRRVDLPRQAVARTRINFKELRARVQEVQNLRNLQFRKYFVRATCSLNQKATSSPRGTYFGPTLTRNRRSVFEKWPRIPTTANVMPAK
jgi:hypothetical protein